MNVTKTAKVSAYVAAGIYGIVGLFKGSDPLSTIFSMYLVFCLVKAVILTPSYFMAGLRGTPVPSVNHSVPFDAEVVKREDE
jgi:hypothetical protein